MQRIGPLVVGLLLLAATLAPAAAMWNPAQTEDSARLQLALEAIQTPASVDATGIIAAVRIPAGSIGQLGLLYGRVGLSDITQTIDSPDPTGTSVPVYTFALGATWSRRVGGTGAASTAGRAGRCSEIGCAWPPPRTSFRRSRRMIRRKTYTQASKVGSGRGQSCFTASPCPRGTTPFPSTS